MHVTRTICPQYRYCIRVIRYRIRVNLPGHEPVRCPGNPSDSELSVPSPAWLRRIGSRGKPCHGLGSWPGPRGSQDKVDPVVCPTTWSLPVRGRQALAGMAVWSPKRLMLGPLRSKGPCAPRHHSIPSCFTVTITNVDTDLPPSLPATEGVISAIVDRRGDDGGGGGGGGSGGRPWPK